MNDNFERGITIALAVGGLLALFGFYFDIDSLGLIWKIIISIPFLGVSAYAYIRSKTNNDKEALKRVKRIIVYASLLVIILIIAIKLFGDHVSDDTKPSASPTISAYPATPSPFDTPESTIAPAPSTPETTPTPTVEPATPSPTPRPEYSQQTIDTFDAGYRYYMVEDYDNAFPLFLQAANSGYPKAALYVGTCYQDGNGVEKNSYAAFDWFAVAAESGLANAQYNLGYCYHAGFGVFQSDELAFEWFLKSAEQNDPLGLLWTGYCYHHAKGVTLDYDLAFKYYSASRDLGNNDAQRRLSELRRDMG